jgi:NDP-sugar pyrophosphorylase family protein
MLERKFNGIPVVNTNGTLHSILFWQDVFGGEVRKEHPTLDIPVVIMAGGKGTRLDPFTRILPKPLIPIGDKTVLETIIGKFLPYSIGHYYITVHHKSKIIKSYFEELRPPYSITFIDEEQPLGTASALQYLRDTLHGPFLLTNCDIIIDTNYANILKLHQEQGNDITIVGSMKRIQIPYGVCVIENGGRLKSLVEKPSYDMLINTGMYLVNSETLRHIPPDRTFHMTDMMDAVMAGGGRVGVFPIDEDEWFDTGEWPEFQRSVARLTNTVL